MYLKNKIRETSLPTRRWAPGSLPAGPAALAGRRGAGRDPQAAGTVEGHSPGWEGLAVHGVSACYSFYLFPDEAGNLRKMSQKKSSVVIWKQRRLPRAPAPSPSAPTGKSRARQHGQHRPALLAQPLQPLPGPRARAHGRGTCCPLPSPSSVDSVSKARPPPRSPRVLNHSTADAPRRTRSPGNPPSAPGPAGAVG